MANRRLGTGSEKGLGAQSAAFEHHHHEVPLLLRGKRKRRQVGNRKPMRFVSLHHHSTFSYLDGFQLPEAHVRRCEELQMDAMAMTEHGNVMSHVKLEKACEKSNIKPIFGCEMYTGRVGNNPTQMKYHLTVLAANAEGYRNLLQLVTMSYAEGFYYEPTVSWDMLRRYKRGLIIMSGCQGSLLFCSFVGGKLIKEEDASYSRGKKVMRRFRDEFGDAYYAEVQAFPELVKSRQANPLIARAADELGVPLVATMDVHYTELEEREIQKVLHNIRPGNKQSLEDQARQWGYKAPLCPPPNDLTILRRLEQTGVPRKQAIRAVLNTGDIAERCSVTLPKLPMVRFPVPDGYRDAHHCWREWIKDGWNFRGFNKLSQAEKARYKAQLRKEVAIIEEKDFVDYHLIVSDFVKWAKDNGVAVGPGRGSAAASLACYCLRITEVNPMLYEDMVFERYIDLNRQDLPDIDLDFDSEARDKLRDYAVSKYGRDCVSNIGTFSTFKARMALDDIARVHRIPKYDVTTIKDLLVERSSGDLRASATIEDTIIQFDAAREVAEKFPEVVQACDLEGNVKGFGIHAAGMVISTQPITTVVPVVTRVVKKELRQVVGIDKEDAERQGLLKLDFLGLNTMAMLAEGLMQLGMSLQDLYNLPLDDPEVLQGFIDNDVVGVFQFDGRTCRSVNGSLKAENFLEVCAVNALARPGPLHNGSANAYIDIKRGVMKPDTMHPAYDRITANTNYQIVYQEQILRIVREIGDFSWTASSYIRKIISKKIGDQEFNRHKGEFLEGALSLHERESGMLPMSEAVALSIWGNCITAGSYALNFAHACSYAMLAYWTMWLKRKHPAAFYAASLAKMGDGAKKKGEVTRSMQLMRDARNHDIQILPPHPVMSDLTWKALDDHRLLAGFKQIDGIAEAMGNAIIEHRMERPITDWAELIAIRGIGVKTVDKIKAFAEHDDPFQVAKLDDDLTAVKEFIRDTGYLPRPTHSATEVPYENGKDTGIVWVGQVVNRNLRDIFESNRARTGEELSRDAVKEPDKNEFCLLYGYDGDEIVNLRINRFLYPKFRDAIWSLRMGHDMVLVQGYKPGWRTAREIYVKQMWVIDPEDDDESETEEEELEAVA